jgi:hypothetical protein
MVVVLLSAWMLTRWAIRPWNVRVPAWTAAALLVAGVSGRQAQAWPRPRPGGR